MADLNEVWPSCGYQTLAVEQNGNLVASDTDYSDICVCEWVPRWTGEFVIHVENLGGIWNQIEVTTN